MQSFSSSPRVALWASLAVLAGVAAAQERSPVPTRIKVEDYGTASGTPTPGPEFQARLEADAEGKTMVRVLGGYPGELAGLLIGRQPQALSLPFGAVLLVDPVVSLFGTFDSERSFALPLDLADPALIGQLYFQGFHYLVPGPGKPAIVVFQLTQGLHVTVAEGNAQPPLAYSGPPLTATLLVGKEPAGKPNTFQLVNRVVVPSTGWDLRLQSVDDRDSVTRVYLTLEAPNPNVGILPVLDTRRLLVDLGSSAGARIEIHIEQSTRGVPSIPAFALAAVIEPDF